MPTLTELLTPRPSGDDTFSFANGKGGWVSIFGGQIVAQALAAAAATVEGKAAHSLHGYFLRAGAFDAPIDAAVERERDGTSFANRRIVLSQAGKPIFSALCSFHQAEAGPDRAELTMPEVPPPEALETIADIPEMFGRSADEPSPLTYIEARAVKGCQPFRGGAPEPAEGIMWFRFRDMDGAAPPLSRAMLAYASDLFLVSIAMQPHRGSAGRRSVITSLDHALHLHADIDPVGWLLFVQDSPWAGHGRALCRGTIFSADGRPVASVTQEALLRLGT